MLNAIAANIVLLASLTGFGMTLERFFPESFCLADRLGMILLVGLGISGTLLFDLGQFRFSRTVALAVVGLGIVACAALLRRRSVFRGRSFRTLRAPLWPALIVGCVLAVTGVAGLAKPTGDLRNDSIAYHYLGPKVWLRDGAIRPVIDQPYTAFPALVESSYGALMSLGGSRAPALFALTGLLALLLISGGLASRLGARPAAAWWAAALVATMPAVYRGSFDGFIDAIYAAFVLCAARIGFDARNMGEYAVFGALCGFAMGTKYTGIIAVALIWGLMVIAIVRDKDRTARLPALERLALACCVAIVIAVPAYARNWVVLGSPIYPPPPGVAHVFRVQYMSAKAIEGFHRYIWMRGRGMGRSLSSFLLLPFNLTYHTADFNGAGGIGLAPLALAPFGVFAAWRERFAKRLLMLAVLLTGAWFVTEQESRFLIDVYVIFAVFAALGISHVFSLEPRFGRALTFAVLICSVTYGLFMIGVARADELHAVVSPSYARQRDRTEIPFIQSFDYLNTHPSVTKVLVPDLSVPTYYCDKDYLKPIGIFGTESVRDPNELITDVERMSRLHISHVLDVRGDGSEFHIPEDLPGLTLVFERPDQRVYRVQ